MAETRNRKEPKGAAIPLYEGPETPVSGSVVSLFVNINLRFQSRPLEELAALRAENARWDRSRKHL